METLELDGPVATDLLLAQQASQVHHAFGNQN